ncbi:MAG TPA: sensor histidine kinase [Steroidobacteraceae bacterium]|nr:sensor histidine kinase [Steroidobacteraceae bacterium]
MRSDPLPARKRVPWGFLAWTVPLAYVLWAPYQQRAGWPEWTATTLTLVTVLTLFLTGITRGEDRKFSARVCAALLCIAACSLAYRASGGIYFPVAAAFVPAAAGGGVGLSVAIVCGITVLFGVEWWLLYLGQASNIFALFVTGEILLTGIGVTFVFRQTREIQRSDKANERERIAKDLHDLLGHSLSSLALKAELARRIFPADPTRALREISDIEHIARQALAEMRGAISGYYAGDICAELDRVEALLKAADVSVERRWQQLDMPPAYERVLALIVREAVTNILRHSQAKACRLAVFQADGFYRLDIADNGCGGDLKEGIGMRSIRTRAEALGGTAVWSSAAGTLLSVTLPASAAGPS